MKVLIAEDDNLSQSLFGRYMRKLGWDHTIVANGLLAVKECKSGNFNVILMDINMPVLDGIEATKRIRIFNKVIPIIAISAFADPDNRQKCNDAGMNAFIELPTSYEIIRDVISNV
jgi:two-component system, sensor histidine kinase